MSLSDISKAIKLLIKAIVGFLIPQKGECEHPDFFDQWSVNLICSYTIPGQAAGFAYDLVGSGQALLALFLMSVIDQQQPGQRSGQRACLELASGFKNIAGLCVYSKLGFLINFIKLLLEPHGGDMFYSPGNLPMSIELVGKTKEEIVSFVMHGAKDELCSFARKSIELDYTGSNTVPPGHYAIADAQREMTAIHFLLYLIDVIIYSTQRTRKNWRNGSTKYGALTRDALETARSLAVNFQTPTPEELWACPDEAARQQLRVRVRTENAPLAARIQHFYGLMDTCLHAGGAGLQELKVDIMHYGEAIKAQPGVFDPNTHANAVAKFNTDRAKEIAKQEAARTKRGLRKGDLVLGLQGSSPDASPRSKFSDQVPSWGSWGSFPSSSSAQGAQGSWFSEDTTPSYQKGIDKMDDTNSSLDGYVSLLDQSPEATRSGFELGQTTGFPPAKTVAQLPNVGYTGQKTGFSLATMAAQNQLQQEPQSRQEQLRRMLVNRGFNPDASSSSSDDEGSDIKRKRRSTTEPNSSNKFQDSKSSFGGGKKTKNKRKKNKPKTKRRAANKKNKKAQQHAGRVSRHNKVFRRKTRKSK
jgi:hypothetical protein